jgi:nicotinamidase/pyrazinamidase
VIPNRACEFDVTGAHQIILQKQTVNAFDALNIGALLGRLGADRYVVYGVVTEICVLHAALGLLKMGKPVMVVADAIAGLKTEDSEKALSQIRAAGGTVGDAASVAHDLKVAPAAP